MTFVTKIKAAVAALVIPLLLSAHTVVDTDRIYSDAPISAISDAKDQNDRKLPSSVKISLGFPKLTKPVRAVTAHLRTPSNNWFSADITKYNLDFGREKTELRIPFSDFQPENAKDDITTATTIRISLWMNEPEIADLFLSAAFAGQASVAIVRSTGSSDANDEQVAAEAAERAESLLRNAKTDYDVVSGNFDKRDLQNRAFVIVPYSPNLSQKQTAVLRDYLKSGGKAVIFYNANQTLARAMEIDVENWKNSTLPWTAIELDNFAGSTQRIPYYTENIIPPARKQGKSVKIAGWIVDNSGRTTEIPAVAISRKGAWVAHLPPRAYPSAVKMIKSIITGGPDAIHKEPKLQNLPLFENKIVGAYLTSPIPRSPGGWKKTAEKLKAQKISTAFVRVQTADTLIHTPSQKPENNLAAAIEECGKNGISFHGWVSCFSLYSLPPAKKERLIKEGRISDVNPGWLDPANENNHALIIDGLERLAATKNIQGIHLDYVRTPFGVAKSREMTDKITKFICNAGRAIRKINPDIKITAAVFPTPESALARNQDWTKWINEGYIDFAVPMIYTTSPETYKSRLRECTAAVSADKILPAIGTGADEIQTDSITTDLEILASQNCLGVTFFAYDSYLEELLGD